MCTGHRLSRRTFLAGTIGAAGALVLGVGRAAPAGALVQADGPEPVDLNGIAVIPRARWGGDLAPTGPIPGEPDVRYLLVHHSVDPGNGYGEADVVGILRGFVGFHTAQKGWPDLAYNFLVDRFGRVWEGRTGSLAGPVAGDATGGNQGFDQLCCFIGNHQADEPSPQAFEAMAGLLGALARRYTIALGPTSTVVFTSRGSNRHPAGTEVTTATIAGHRDMSRTQCPGDLVTARLPQLRLLAASPAPPAGTAAPTDSAAPRPAPAPAPAATPEPTAAPVASAGPAATSAGQTTSGGSSAMTKGLGGSAGRRASERDGPGGIGPTGAVTAGAAAAAAGAVWARRRQRGSVQPGADGPAQSPEQSF